MADSSGLQALSAYREDIDNGMRQFFAELPQLLTLDLSAHSQQALERLEAFCLRPGKRLRGSLAALTYDAASNTSHAPAGIQLAVVLELMQAYLLIVDDVMDRSELRRGQPAVHMLYRQEQLERHQADMIAINVGLLGQHLASLCLAHIDVQAENLRQAAQLLQHNIAATAFGQLDDIAGQLGPEMRESDIIRKYTLKSSYYTFVNPLQLGLALAGKATAEALQACLSYGVPAGVAFQLHDDYLGIFGNVDQTGKANLDDIREGKVTLLMQYTLANGDASVVEQLERVVGNSQATADDLRAVQALLTDTGAKEYCWQQVQSYAAVAKHSLQTQPIGPSELAHTLASIIDYAVTREY